MEERQEEKKAKMHRTVFRTKEKLAKWKKDKRKRTARCIKMHRTVLRTIGKTSKMEERQGKELQDASYSP